MKERTVRGALVVVTVGGAFLRTTLLSSSCLETIKIEARFALQKNHYCAPRRRRSQALLDGGDGDHPIGSPYKQGSCGRFTMDQDTEAILQGKNVRAEPDKMTKNGRIVDLVRQFMILPKETRREYSIVVDETEYDFRQIENLAREFGIEEN
jgi:hypothetical protein